VSTLRDMAPVASVKARALQLAGGPARLQIILVLAGVLGLDMADQGTVSAVSDQVKQAFHIGNTEIGLLLAVVSFIGTVATMPMGVLADRFNRKAILMAAVSAWALAMAITGFAMAMGAVISAAWPCVASLSGDFFPAQERAQKHARQQGVKPREELVLQRDPTGMGWWAVMRYLLRLPPYRLLIIASALAYYFFSGARAFAMIYFTAHYHLPRTIVSMLVFGIGIGALFGVVFGGRLSERLLRQGRLSARIVVPLIGAGIGLTTPWLAVPLLVVGAAALTAAAAPTAAASLEATQAKQTKTKTEGKDRGLAAAAE